MQWVADQQGLHKSYGVHSNGRINFSGQISYSTCPLSKLLLKGERVCFNPFNKLFPVVKDLVKPLATQSLVAWEMRSSKQDLDHAAKGNSHHSVKDTTVALSAEGA